MAKKGPQVKGKTAPIAKAVAKRKTSGTARTKARSKTEILASIAEEVGISKKQVSHVFQALQSVAEKDLSKGGPGVFKVPGLVKLRLVNKPATKSRKGINPFTGEEITIKAKPARNVVRARPLKSLLETVA